MTREKTGKGTHYEPSKMEQRSYYLPLGLGDAFKEFCNGNASTGARGAFILFMACRGFPDLRERAIRAGEQMEIPAAIDEIEKRLADAVEVKLIEQWALSLPQGERAKVLAEVRQKK
jgi:hypothetical protein